MVRETYDLAAEPRGAVYEKLLAAGLPHCDQFLFVDVQTRRNGIVESAFQASARAVVRELEPHLIRVELSLSWPGTVVSEQPDLDLRARVYRYRFHRKTTLQVLTRVAITFTRGGGRTYRRISA